MAIAVALLVSADPVTIHQVSHALQELSISSDVCQEEPASIRLLNCRKFDAVIVDLQLGEQSGLILDEVHSSKSNRTAVTFAISSSDGAVTAALHRRCSFLFERPLSEESIRNTLKPAYGLILRERRRYFRYPVTVPVTILRQSMPEVRCHSVNISEGGMAVSTFVSLSPGEDVQVQFTLPEHKVPFLAESRICWWKTGHLGVRFVSFSSECQSELQEWLARKLEEMLPEFVAGKFQKAEASSITTLGDRKPNQATGSEVPSRLTKDADSDAEQRTTELALDGRKVRLANHKILFVDNEPAALNFYRQMLKSEFDVVTTASGEEGLVSLRDHGPFAVVISGMHMAGMDGVQFLKRVRQVAPNTIRLLLTSHLDLNGAVNAVNEGWVFRMLIKPCEKSLLTEAITKALDCYRERREERVRIELPIRLCRAAPNLKPQLARTVDISNSGARLAGLEELLEPGEVVKLECGNRAAPFRVVWAGAQGTASAGQAGLECLAADADLWKMDLRQLEDDKPLMRARAVQRGLLPQEKPSLETLDYAGNCVQARTIGGDYYDFLDMGPGEVGLVLADIAGKGIAAALLMASLQGSLYSQYSSQYRAGSKDIPLLLASVNRHFYKHTAKDRYASLFFGRYSDATRTLTYVNCGHNPPVLLRKGGAVERLAATATVLGLFSDWDCSVAEVRLETGDVLTIYTDGITETTGYRGEEFGETRLLETLRKNRELEASCILRNVEDAAEQFRLGEQEDDLTLVIARTL